MLTPRTISSLLLPILFLSIGCNTSSTPATVACRGTLLMNDKPLDVANRELGLGMVTLEFIPVEATGPTPQKYGATADKDGRFSFPGGVPPGKYKVAVRQWDPYPNADKLQGAFAEGKTPIVRTLDGSGSIAIDLAQPE